MVVAAAEIWLRRLLRSRSAVGAAERRRQATGRSHHQLTVPVLLLAVGVSALCGWVLWQGHRATEARAIEAATSIVNSLRTDIERNVEFLNLSLEAVQNSVNLPELGTLSEQMRRRVLFDNSLRARDVTSILVTDETGRVVMDSRRSHPMQLNLSDRDFFQVQRDHPYIGLFISAPFISRTNGLAMIGLSRRISHADGSFGGIAVGAMLQDYFESLFKDISLGPHGSVTLARIDGTVLMRWPYQAGFIGSNISRAALFDHFPRAASGHYESTAVSDGTRRLFVFSQVGDLPLVIVVGQSIDDVFAPWRAQALAIGVAMVVLCALSVVLAALLRRELIWRSAAERKLTVLATTDGLTGLANRRHFNRTLGYEWRRAMRGGAPIALLMIDADNLKLYNDKYGHQAGDELLKTIAAAVARLARRPSDLGVRFGGDEFAILLPETSLADAAELAERLRTDLLLSGGAGETGCESVRLSIGVGCRVPRQGANQRDLVAAADKALYRAKQQGRNRIELAEIDAGSLAPETMEVEMS